MSAVDDYIDGLEPSEKAALEHIRSLVRALVPEVEEGTSYGMPAMKYKKKPLLGFIAAQHHLSLFPFSSEVIDATRDRLGGFELSKGTIRFSVANPIPDDVIGDIVRSRLDQINGTSR